MLKYFYSLFISSYKVKTLITTATKDFMINKLYKSGEVKEGETKLTA